MLWNKANNIQAGVTSLIKIPSPYFALMSLDLTCIETIKSLVNHAGAFDLEYDVKFLDYRWKGIIDYTPSWVFLQGSLKAPYMWNILFAKLCVTDSVQLAVV